jgi:hypothetical protein
MDLRLLRSGKWRIAAFALLLLCVAVMRGRAVAGRLPYSQHIDEIHLTSHANQMLVRHDLNPRFFRYPSLPIYLTLASMRVGAAFGPEVPPNRWKIARKGEPFAPARAFAVPRYVFSAFSVLTAGLVGWIARKLTGCTYMLLVAPLILATSRTFQTSAALYLNVDVVATFFVMAALAVSCAIWARGGPVLRWAVPGALTGMAIASKYSVALAVAPCVLSILLSSSEKRGKKVLAYAAATVFTFFLCVPYSLLTPGPFITDVIYEMNHYRTGHERFDGPPGIPQLVYYTSELFKDYGPATSLLAGVGAAWGLATKRRLVLVLLSLPVLMLLYMATNRVHFLRTVLPVFALFPVFAAAGVHAISSALRSRFQAFGGRPKRSLLALRVGSGLPVAVGCATAILFGNADAIFDRNLAPESRNRARDWLVSNGKDGSVVTAPELRFSNEALKLLGGREMAITAANLTKLVSTRRPAYAVVPAYPIAKRAGLTAAAGTLDAVRAVKGSKVFEADGADSRFRLGTFRSPEVVVNPALVIFRIP